MLAEIKEINEKKRKEDDALLAIAAGNRRPILPNMEFEFLDMDIHEDLYRIIKYSCGEVCSSIEQVDKVMRIWTTFLEPMLGIPPRSHGIEDKEAIVVKTNSDHKPLADYAGGHTKQSDLVFNGDENIAIEDKSSCWARLDNNDVADKKVHDVDPVPHQKDVRSTPSNVKSQNNAHTPDKVSGFDIQSACIDQFTDNGSVRPELCHGMIRESQFSSFYWIISIILMTL